MCLCGQLERRLGPGAVCATVDEFNDAVEATVRYRPPCPLPHAFKAPAVNARPLLGGTEGGGITAKDVVRTVGTSPLPSGARGGTATVQDVDFDDLLEHTRPGLLRVFLRGMQLARILPYFDAAVRHYRSTIDIRAF